MIFKSVHTRYLDPASLHMLFNIQMIVIPLISVQGEFPFVTLLIRNDEHR